MITCGAAQGGNHARNGHRRARPAMRGLAPRAWPVLAALAGAALAGAAGASSPAETPSEQAATSSAQATVLRRLPGRGVSHSRAAPAR